MPLVRFATVTLDDARVGYCRFEPGWRWSQAMGPVFGLTSCPTRHLGYTVSGSVRVVMDDGQVLDVGPDQVFDIPAGHDKWVLGDEPWVTIEWGGSARAMREAFDDSAERMLATVVFTDIVDSTATVRRLGDAAWRDRLSAHNERMRELLNAFRDREVATTGDGVLALFDSPTRAVRFAIAMVAAARQLDVAVRVGVHTGEVEVVGDDVRGIAVHLAARVVAAAGADEILVSGTTADLVDGAGLPLEDAGAFELKGIKGERRLFRVRVGS